MIPRTTTTTMKRGDTAPALVVHCYDKDRPVPLDAAQSVRVIGLLGGIMVVDGQAEVTDASAGQITYAWVPSDTANVGDMLIEIEVTWDDGTVQTFPGAGWLVVKVVADLA